MAFRALEHVLLRKETLDTASLYHRGQLGGIEGRSIQLGLVELSTCIAHAHAFADVGDAVQGEFDDAECSILPKFGVLRQRLQSDTPSERSTPGELVFCACCQLGRGQMAPSC
eukprot:576586-Amphidinium_carterae.1